MAGMAAKTMCSCVFLTGRDPQSVKDKELQVFPGLSSAAIDVHADSTVTATVFWKTSKAIFRKNLGCTLLAEQTEDEVRSQKATMSQLPSDQDTIAWPTGNVVNDSNLPGVNYDMIRRSLEEAFHEANPERPVNTHAVVAVYKNKIIGEKPWIISNPIYVK